MKNLDLNKYGVQKMNAGEMLTTEGGSLWSTLCQVVKDAISNTITTWI